MAEAEASWKLLIRALLARVRVQARYGDAEGSVQDAGVAILAAQGATGHKKARRGSKAAATDGGRVRRSATKGAAERQLVAGAEEGTVATPDDMEEI